MPPAHAQQARPKDVGHDVEIALNRALRIASGGGMHVALGDQATLTVPEHQFFLPRPGADDLLRAADRPVPSDYTGMIIDDSAADWFALLRVVAHGYVDAGAVTGWTANDVLASVRDTIDHANGPRIAHGDPPLEARRWVQPPLYDAASRRLTWCVLIVARDARRDAGGEIVCHGATFGQSGYVKLSMTTTLDRWSWQTAIPGTILDQVAFLPGHGYADYRAGTDADDPDGLAGVFGVERLRKADLKTRLRAFAQPLIIPGAVTLIAALSIGLVVLLSRWRHLRRPLRRSLRRS